MRVGLIGQAFQSLTFHGLRRQKRNGLPARHIFSNRRLCAAFKTRINQTKGLTISRARTALAAFACSAHQMGIERSRFALYAPTIQPLLEPKNVLLPFDRRIRITIRRNGRYDPCAVWVLELTDLD